MVGPSRVEANVGNESSVTVLVNVKLLQPLEFVSYTLIEPELVSPHKTVIELPVPPEDCVPPFIVHA